MTQHMFHNTQHDLTYYADHKVNTHKRLRYMLGRLAVLPSRVRTGYVHNTLEVINTEGTPANATSRRTSFCSTYNSVDEVPKTLSSGVVDDPRIGRLASPLLEQ